MFILQNLLRITSFFYRQPLSVFYCIGMSLLDKIFDEVQKQPLRVIYSEGDDDRVVQAAFDVLEKNLAAKVLLVGDQKTLEQKTSAYNFANEKLQIVDPADEKWNTPMAEKLMALKAKDYPDMEQAKEAVRDRVLLAALLHVSGEADIHVSGAVETSAKVIRTFYSILKLDRSAKMATSFFLMLGKNKNLGEDGNLLFADCAVNIAPNPKQLGRIAYLVGNIARDIFSFTTRLAFLSYSTKGSGTGEAVEKMLDAKSELAKLEPNFIYDSEYQADAALAEAVAVQKIPNREDDKIGGKANVLIFPDINTGNISYKIAQRFGDMTAIGPVMVGLNYFASDLSRGCTAYDIVATTATVSYYYLRSGKKE